MQIDLIVARGVAQAAKSEHNDINVCYSIVYRLSGPTSGPRIGRFFNVRMCVHGNVACVYMAMSYNVQRLTRHSIL